MILKEIEKLNSLPIEKLHKLYYDNMEIMEHNYQHLKTLEKKKPVIACGDFNVAYTPIDLSNPKSNYNKTAGYTQSEIDGMNALIQSGFVDSFRFFHPNETAYTYWSYRFKARKRNIGWRIDYFLIRKFLID